MRTEQWTLDGVGNWLIDTVNGVPDTRTVNSTNQYTSINANSLTYDRNGNLTSAASVGYQWDYKNRLRGVCSLPSGVASCTTLGAVMIASYSYDAMNRRIRKVSTNSGSLNGSTNFYYDGWRTIEERDGFDNLTQQYVYGVYFDEPIVLDRADGQRLFYHQNALFSTFALTDLGANVIEGYEYDAYGQQTVFGPGFGTVLPPLGGLGNPIMFTGQRFDAETGLMYYRNRYYLIDLGRFLQRDPQGYRGGSTNLYIYAYDAPVSFVDSLGEQAATGKASIEVTLGWGAPAQAPGYTMNTQYTGFKSVEYTGFTPDFVLSLQADVWCEGNQVKVNRVRDNQSGQDPYGWITHLIGGSWSGFGQIVSDDSDRCVGGKRLQFRFAAVGSRSKAANDLFNIVSGLTGAIPNPAHSGAAAGITALVQAVVNNSEPDTGAYVREYHVCCTCCSVTYWDTGWNDPEKTVDARQGIDREVTYTGAKKACLVGPTAPKIGIDRNNDLPPYPPGVSWQQGHYSHP
jgi:RHS repeat-associated protein